MSVEGKDAVGLHSQIKAAASQYWSQGLNIVLLKAKKPIHKWERWQTGRQSRYDFDVLPWDEADGFALIGGSKLDNGLYVGAVDYDVKNVSEEAKEKGERALKKMPITQMEETPSGGQHRLYYSRVKPSSISAYHNECALELLGEGKLIIMAPSKGYRRLNDNFPTAVDNVEDMFLKALRSVGVTTKQEVTPVATSDVPAQDFLEHSRLDAGKGFSELRTSMSEKYPVWWEKLVEERKAEGFKAGDLVAIEPQLFRRFMNHLSRFVVHDVSTKTLVFFTALSAYTKDPINLFLRGESSIGKSYNVTQTLKYFPDEDVLMLGGLSPTAIVHDYGVLVDRNGDLIDFSEKPSKRKPKRGKKESGEEYLRRVEEWEEAHKRWNEKIQNARYIIELSNKILVFLEAPPLETYNRLRPILSHDKEEISYKFTDKVGGQLRTMHVVVKGWPATIFLTTAEEYIEDLATRSFTITPETHEAKIGDAVRLQGKQDALPWQYKMEDPEWMLLRGYIVFLRNHIPDFGVVNPFARELAEAYPAVLPRAMRDFKHIRALIKTCALFHTFQRPVLFVDEEKYVMCTLKDLAFVLSILLEIEETTVTGLSKQVLECFHKVMKPLYENYGAFNYERLTRNYNEVFPKKRSSSTLRNYVQLLRKVGYVDTILDSTDARKRLIAIIKKNDENLRDSVLNKFSKSFSLESLKSWFEDVKKNPSGKTTFFLCTKSLKTMKRTLKKYTSNITLRHFCPYIIWILQDRFLQRVLSRLRA